MPETDTSPESSGNESGSGDRHSAGLQGLDAVLHRRQLPDLLARAVQVAADGAVEDREVTAGGIGHVRLDGAGIGQPKFGAVVDGFRSR